MSEKLLPHQVQPVDRTSLGRGRLQLQVVTLESGLEPSTSLGMCHCFQADED